MRTPQRFQELLHLYKTNRISNTELQEFFSIVHSSGEDALIAAEILSTLKEAGNSKEPGLPAYRAEEIMRAIMSAEKEARRLIPEKRSWVRRFRWVALAALLTGVLAYGSYVWISNVYESSRHSFRAIIPKETKHIENTTSLPMTVLLEDRSRVLLDPGAAISYLPGFLPGRREVYLEGAAFFDIVRDARRPFLVFSNKTVIKVLGTSFKVKPDVQARELEVAVVTGKVQVYENRVMVKDSREDKGIIITPNQRVFYNEKNREFRTTLVEHPLMLTEEPVRPARATQKQIDRQVPDFIYKSVTVDQVLQEITASYGIDIVVENEDIYNCEFTGDISAMGLFEKLNVITQAIKASYEIHEAKILIKGEGCRS